MEDKNIKLIDGTFSSEEALEILVKLMRHKINFHELKKFSHFERFGNEEYSSNDRLEELKKDLEIVKNYLNEAKAEGQTVEIESFVNIRLKTKTLATK